MLVVHLPYNIQAKLSFYALPESYSIDDETMPGEDEEDE